MNTNSKIGVKTYLKTHGQKIEDLLSKMLPQSDSEIQTQLNQALKYAVFSGGKRIRPLLTLLGTEFFTKDLEQIYPATVAVEFIHTSSLIFDDLPCMDNASLRRGKTSLHEKFGEGIAVLSGLTLLNSAYQIIANQNNFQSESIRKAQTEMADCIGVMGMIGGQAIDLHSHKIPIKCDKSLAEIESIKNLKTTSLMRLSLCLGAILVGADSEKINNLREFSNKLGEAYQLRDDIFDVKEDISERKTLIIEEGINSAKIRLKNLVENANKILLDNFPVCDARNILLQISDSLAEPIK